MRASKLSIIARLAIFLALCIGTTAIAKSLTSSIRLAPLWKRASAVALQDVPQELYSFRTALPYYLHVDGTTLAQEWSGPLPLLPSLKFRALAAVLAADYRIEYLFNYNFYNREQAIIPPVFSDLPVDSDKTETFPTQAVAFVKTKEDVPLILMMSINGVSILHHIAQESAAIGLKRSIDTWCAQNNFYKNKALVYTKPNPWSAYFDFLPGFYRETLRWEQLILPPPLKTKVKFETEDFVRNFARYEELGIPTKRGVLLAGPPGTGKTLISRVLMSQLRGQITFLYVTAKSLKQPEDISGIYETARLLAPSMIIMEDIDMIGGKDRSDQQQAALLNEWLNQLDGLQGVRRLITIGSTNDDASLDPALLRPGRFDAHLRIGLPDYLARLELLRFATSDVELAADVDLAALANRTTSYSGAKLSDLVIRAKKFALHESSTSPNGRLLLRASHIERALAELDDHT